MRLTTIATLAGLGGCTVWSSTLEVDPDPAQQARVDAGPPIVGGSIAMDGDLGIAADITDDGRRRAGRGPGRSARPVARHPAGPLLAMEDPDAARRGEVLFQRSDVGCAGCHSGALLTDNLAWDVGTGPTHRPAFETPSLVGLGNRLPLMHDGCAATLADRFTEPCGGGESHGRTAHLGEDEIADLVTYLRSL